MPLRMRQEEIEQLPLLATLGVPEIESQLAEAGEELPGEGRTGVVHVQSSS